MRILHTADWHLGKKLKRISRRDDLRRSVEAVFGYCESESVDVLLIAGDLFDSVCRPDDICDAIDHLKETARSFLQRGGTILATTGNHDGETFCTTLQHTLALANPVAPKNGETLAPGRFHLITRPAFYQLADRSGQPVQFVLMPYPTSSRYLDDAVTPYQGGPEAKNRRLRRAFAETLQRIRRHSTFDSKLHTVLAAHLFLKGATLPAGEIVTEEFERSDIVCPVDDLGAGWAYVALGHIHKPQSLGGRPNVRYSGSIERMDYGERDDDTGIVILDIGPRGLNQVPAWHPLEASTFLDISITNPSVDLPELEERYAVPTQALVRCHVQYTPGEDDPDAIHARLDRLFPRCYERTVSPRRSDSDSKAVVTIAGLTERSVREVVLDYLALRLEGRPEAETMAVLAEAETLMQETDR